MAAVTTTVEAPPGGDASRSGGAEERPHGPVTLLGSTVEGDPLPRMRRRLTPLHFRSDTVWGWLAPIILTLLTGILQFWSITTPHDITFDETYYAKDAYSLLTQGYARSFVNDPDTDESEADKIINSGSTEGIFADDPSLVVHPEVGKWMIAIGEWLFGLTPLGWRFSAAFFGALMVLVMCRLVRRLTGSTLFGCVAGALLALDGLHFVMSRIALLDIFVAFWLLCATHCLVADRDWARARIARLSQVTPRRGRGDFGPIRGLLFRPWRIAAGVCFGLACGSKWSALFVVAGLGLLSWLWDIGMRRAAGVRLPTLKSLAVDAGPAFLSVVGVGFVVYVVSWMGFLTHAQTFEDHFGKAVDDNDWSWSSLDDNRDGSILGVDTPINDELYGARHDLNMLWNYHIELWKFHTGQYIKDATHPFQSHPGGWLLINRPLGIAATSGDSTVIPECPPDESCVKQVLAIGTPVLWWGGVLALFASVGYWVFRRDWRFGVPVVGVLTTWLPWFWNDERPIFFFYAVAIVPYTVISVTLVLGKLVGSHRAPYGRRIIGITAAALFVAAVAINFIYFYPIWTNGLLSNEDWNDRMWIDSWI
jgi:dolichyl-phosphate-mannose--protein O-mannosyl transferase